MMGNNNQQLNICASRQVGNYVFGPQNFKADWKDHLFVHEYGHYLQSQDYGISYLFAIGVPSLISAGKDKEYFKDDKNLRYEKHDLRWYERDANSRAADYFGYSYGDWEEGSLWGGFYVKYPLYKINY